MMRIISQLGPLAWLRRVLRTRLVASLTRRRNRETPMKIACFPGDDIGDNVIAHGWYEDQLLKALFDALLVEHAASFARGTAVDVGANIGNHSIWFSRRFARVLAFEPNPVCVKLLEANVLFNGLSNIRLFPIGLSDESAQLEFHMDKGGNLGRSGVAHSLRDQTDAHFPVRVEAGDSVLTDEVLGEHPLRLLKLDIEGHEFRAIKGLAGIIARHAPIILFESHGSGGEQGSDAIVALLSPLGYQHYYVIERVRTPFRARFMRAAYRLARGERWIARKVPRPGDRSYSLVVAAPRPLWLGAASNGMPASRQPEA